jgi:hypothetical protein
MEVTLRLLAPERMASRNAVAASESGNLPQNRGHIKRIYICTNRPVDSSVHIKLVFVLFLFNFFFGGLERVGHSFAYVTQ